MKREHAKWLGIGGLALVIAGALSYSVRGMADLWFWLPLGLGAAGAAAFFLEYKAEAAEVIRSRKARHGFNSLAYTLLMVAVAVLVQAIASNHDLSWDLTKNKVNTLSDEAVKAVKNLEAPVQVLGFFGPGDQNQRRFEDLLKRLKRHNASKFSYEFVDMNKKPLLAGQYAVRSSGTSVVISGSRHESISMSTEEELVNALNKLGAGTAKAVYFLSGHGERSTADAEQNGLSEFKKALEAAAFKVQDLALIQAGSVPADAAALVLAGPRTEYLQPELALLDPWMAKGGRLVVAVDPRAQASTLTRWLQKAGVVLGNDVVVDMNPLNQLFGGGPIAPVVKNLDASHAATKDIVQQGGQVVVPFTRTVSQASSLPPNTTATPLLTTFPSAWAYRGDSNNLPSKPSATDMKGPLTLALAVDADPALFGGTGSDRKARLVVLGSAGLLSNNALPAFNNQDFAVNAVRWLSDEEKRISIAPRNEDQAPLMIDAGRWRLIFWSLVALCLGTLAAGVVVTLRRRRAA